MQRRVPPANGGVIQHTFSKNCNQQAVQEQDGEASEVIMRFLSKCVAVGYMQVNKQRSAAKNIFRKWKVAATVALQPKDDSHTNAKAH